MLSSLWVTAQYPTSNTGSSAIHGEPVGAMAVTSSWRKVLTCVALKNTSSKWKLSKTEPVLVISHNIMDPQLQFSHHVLSKII